MAEINSERMATSMSVTWGSMDGDKKLSIIVGVCREDSRADVDEAYGEGTYDRLFPDTDSDENDGGHDNGMPNS